jgi:hypothetical protein
MRTTYRLNEEGQRRLLAWLQSVATLAACPYLVQALVEEEADTKPGPMVRWQLPKELAATGGPCTFYAPRRLFKRVNPALDVVITIAMWVGVFVCVALAAF